MLYFLLILLNLTIDYQHSFSSQGTLVVSIPTVDGLVICADKRSYDSVRGDLDNNQKIIQIDKYSSFVITGTPLYLSKKNYDTLFSAEKVILDYLKFHSIDEENIIESLGQHICYIFDNFIKKQKFEEWPLSDEESNYELFQVCFFTFSKTYNCFKYPAFKFIYQKKYPEPILAFQPLIYRNEDSTLITPLIFGNLKVYNKIKTENDFRFKVYKDEPLIKKFLLNNTTKVSVTLDETIKFCKLFFYINYKMTPLIDNSNHHIGPTVDMALINPQNGFKWIYQNFDVSQRSMQD